VSARVRTCLWRAMILGSQQADLGEYCNHFDRDCDSNDDKEGSDNDEDISKGEHLERGNRQAPPTRELPPKIAKAS